MAVLQSAATFGALFGGTNTYTRTGLSALTAGQGIQVAVQFEGTRACTGITLGSTGTPTSLTIGPAIATFVYIFYGTVTGLEGDTNVIVNASGNIADNTGYSVLITDSWISNQSSADQETLSSSGTNFDVPAVTPPTANNLIMAAADRANRTWTEDSDFTMLTTGDPRWATGYIVQSAATPQGYTIVADSSGTANILLIAFAGSGAAAGPLPFRTQVGAKRVA